MSIVTTRVDVWSAITFVNSQTLDRFAVTLSDTQKHVLRINTNMSPGTFGSTLLSHCLGITYAKHGWVSPMMRIINNTLGGNITTGFVNYEYIVNM